jgi:integrase/recombinase XerD
VARAYLEPDEIEKLIAAAKCQRDAIFVRSLYRSGCRVSEAIALEEKEVDFNQGTITIQHLKSRISLACPGCGARLGRNHSFCPKCGMKIEGAIAKEQEHRRVRTIPLDKETLKILEDFIKEGGSVKRGDKNLLFPFNRHRGWQIIRECAQRAGLPNLVNPESGRSHSVSPHKLRDAFAIHAMKVDDSGDGMRLLQEHLGHASFNTTARYRKIAGEEHKAWYERLWQQKESV